MKAGRELDAEIAKKIYGRRPFKKRWESGIHRGFLDCWLDAQGFELDGAPDEQLPRYSTEMKEAWELLCEMGRRGFGHEIEGDPKRGFRCTFRHVANGRTGGHAGQDYFANICLAALKAQESPSTEGKDEK